VVCQSESVEIIQQRLLVLQETAKRSVLILFYKMAFAHLSESELSPSKFVKSRPRPLSSSNSPQASAHLAVTCCASLGALLAMTVAFPATTVISYLQTVPSPTTISASPVMTLVANISTSKDPTGTGCRPPLRSVLPTVRLKVRLSRVHNSVLISVQASATEHVGPFTLGLLCDKII
jgi:hypothetical protein